MTSRPTIARNRRRWPRPAAAGFSLMAVLAAILLLGFGLLGLARAYMGITAATTQNQLVSSLANLSNVFWGQLQANPALVSAGIDGTWTQANLGSAPAGLQPWLTLATDPVTGIPGASITIATGPDIGKGSSCNPATGCSVRVTVSWQQHGTMGDADGTARSQTFWYQVGL